MDITENTISDRCTQAVFKRGENYYQDGHVQQINRFDDLVTATVEGSQLYDVTINFGGRSPDARCTCPYDGGGDCKHVVAVLLDIAAEPPADDSDSVKQVVASQSPLEFASGALS